MYKILGGDGKQYGPIPAETLREWIQQGRANAETQVLAEGATSWQALGTVAEFADALGLAAPMGFAGAAVADTSAYDAAVRLANPAGWALMILGILSILMCIAFIVFYAVKGVPANPFEGMFGQSHQTEAMRAGQKIGTFGALIVGLAEAGFFIFAGLKLRRLESWGLVLTAAILAIIPCCGTQAPLCLLSIPVGIWVIVVLCQSKVKSAFT
jgi:hypothetical protein